MLKLKLGSGGEMLGFVSRGRQRDMARHSRRDSLCGFGGAFPFSLTVWKTQCELVGDSVVLALQFVLPTPHWALTACQLWHNRRQFTVQQFHPAGCRQVLTQSATVILTSA
jgi:hypothetical protein